MCTGRTGAEDACNKEVPGHLSGHYGQDTMAFTPAANFASTKSFISTNSFSIVQECTSVGHTCEHLSYLGAVLMCFCLLSFGKRKIGAVCTLCACVEEEQRMLPTKILSGHYGQEAMV
jgi:hypothetical protein